MISPQDFLIQAKRLVENKQEVDFRSAISRAYYSLYHESIEYLKRNYKSKFVTKIKSELNFSMNTVYTNVDSKLIEQLDTDYIRKQGVNLHKVIPNTYILINKKNFGNDFKDMREERNIADYQVSQNIDYPTAKRLVSDMEDMINQLK